MEHILVAFNMLSENPRLLAEPAEKGYNDTSSVSVSPAAKAPTALIRVCGK
jgi:hypothetical protein